MDSVLWKVMDGSGGGKSDGGGKEEGKEEIIDEKEEEVKGESERGNCAK